MAQVKQKSSSRDTLSEGASSILVVAEQLFANRGYDAVSINDIAQGADISKANIFHHFKSKEKLYLAVLKMAASRSTEALDIVKGDTVGNPVEHISNFFSGHLQSLLAQPLSIRLILWELFEHGEQRGERLAEEVFSETFSRVVNLVQEAQTQGHIRTDIDTSLLAFLLLGANIFYFETRAVLKHMPGVNFAESPDLYSSAVFDLLLHGFAKSS